MEVTKKIFCPVCGYELDFEPWNGESPSDEICPCCSVQFGYSDVGYGDRVEIHKTLRQYWIREGMPWDLGKSNPPPNWDPIKQLENIGIKLPAKQS